MIKKAIIYAVLFFLALSFVQWIMSKEIQWGFNLESSFMAFLFMLLFNWANVPYQWKKGDKGN